VDTDLNEDEKTFESEFHKIYFNPADEKAAGTYLTTYLLVMPEMLVGLPTKV
jgi:hypothetical protein